MEQWLIFEKPEPHNQYPWVRIDVHIKNNQTGEVRLHKTDAIWSKEERGPSLFIWQEGNFSCDCNRAIFFYGNSDVDRDCDGDVFGVNIENPVTGTIIYREFEK